MFVAFCVVSNLTLINYVFTGLVFFQYFAMFTQFGLQICGCDKIIIFVKL